MFVLSFVAYKLYTKVINIVFFIINQFIISQHIHRIVDFLF